MSAQYTVVIVNLRTHGSATLTEMNGLGEDARKTNISEECPPSVWTSRSRASRGDSARRHISYTQVEREYEIPAHTTYLRSSVAAVSVMRLCFPDGSTTKQAQEVDLMPHVH